MTNHSKDVVKITECDINKASKYSRDGYVIKKSGKYILSENVKWENKKSNSFAITIDAENVTLNLDGFYIKQVDTTLANGAAINVTDRAKFTLIENGTLRRFSGAGIVVQSGSSFVTINNITVEQTGYNGAYFIDFAPFGKLPGVAGIFVGGDETKITHDINISNCNLYNNGMYSGKFIPNGFVFGIAVNHSTDITIKNITSKKLFGDYFANPIEVGYSSGLLISDINIFDVFGHREAIGISCHVTDNSIMENINAMNIELNIPVDAIPASRGAEGLKYTSSTNFVLRRSTFNGMKVVSDAPNDQTGENTLVCAGVSVTTFPNESQTNGLIENVNVLNLNSDGGKLSTNGARAGGFSIDGGRNMRYSDCTVSGVSTSNGWAFGFGSKLPSDNTLRNPYNVFERCVAQNIEVTDDAQYAAGFLLSADNEQVLNSSAYRIMDKRENPQAYGIILDKFSTGEANRCLISGNRLTNCDTAGIFDNTVAKNSTFVNNYTAMNGNGSFPTI